MVRRLIALAVAAVGVGVLAPSALAAAQLRVLHAAPDVPAVTVYVNGKAAVPSLGTLASTKYLSLPAGTYRVAVSLAGKPESEAALRATIRLKDKQRYTAMARGLLARSTAELALVTDMAKAPGKGVAAIRVAHLSPDAPKVDVYVNGKRTLAGVPYEALSKYLRVKPGTYRIRITAAGTQTAVFDQRLRLRGGQAVTAAAVGALNADGAKFAVKVLRDAAR
ncbi:MAG TPA: DUF4397 domain-containing protein [Gaiellaceae bacterium]|nr:DUF4397 domain-containing protein [Gaiellaceae bacterium]